MMTWTPERITELKRLWVTGASTAEIGRQLDVSKNAVVGKVHRLGLPGRPSPIRREARTVARPGVAESRPRSRPQIPGEFEASPIMAQGESIPRAATEAECRAQAVVDLHAPPCQWPFGDPGDKDFHFCGKNTHETFSYCAEHVAMAYREPEPRRSAPVSPRRHAA